MKNQDVLRKERKNKVNLLSKKFNPRIPIKINPNMLNVKGKRRNANSDLPKKINPKMEQKGH